MNWMPAHADETTTAAYAAVAELADWCDWLPFADARHLAPREPGVYLLREQAGTIRYAGMAGERASGGRPQGLRGRLAVYWTGKGAVSGFGEAALDRALADPEFLEQQLRRLRSTGPQRAKEWAAQAVLRLGLELSWAVTADRGDALFLENQVVTLLRPHGLWNR